MRAALSALRASPVRAAVMSTVSPPGSAVFGSAPPRSSRSTMRAVAVGCRERERRHAVAVRGLDDWLPPRRSWSTRSSESLWTAQCRAVDPSERRRVDVGLLLQPARTAAASPALRGIDERTIARRTERDRRETNGIVTTTLIRRIVPIVFQWRRGPTPAANSSLDASLRIRLCLEPQAHRPQALSCSCPLQIRQPSGAVGEAVFRRRPCRGASGRDSSTACWPGRRGGVRPASAPQPPPARTTGRLTGVW